MNGYNRTIDWVQFLVYLWKNKKKIILVSICTALLFVCVKCMVGPRKADNRAGLPDIINQNHDAFYNLLDKSIYTDAKAPTGTYNSFSQLYIDFKMERDPAASNIILESNTYTLLGNDLQNIARSIDSMNFIIDELNLHSYSDMRTITGDQLRWLINCNLRGKSTVIICVTDVLPDRAQMIAEKVVDHFIENANEYLNVNGIKEIDAPSLPPEITSTAVTLDKKGVIMYGLAGLFTGMVAILFILLLMYVIVPTVRSDKDFIGMGIPLFGIIKDKKTDFKKVLVKLNIFSSEKIAFVNIDDHSDVTAIIQSIKELETKDVSRIEFIGIQNANNNPDSVFDIKDADAYVLVCTYGKTKIGDIIEINGLLQDMQLVNHGALLVYA